MFILGFIADPIINLYVDPYTTISSASKSKLKVKVESPLPHESSWGEHFLKGLASLGLLGFVKVLLAMSPWQWWNMRNSGLLGGGRRAGGTGRDRLGSISWIVVLIGVLTFLWGVYKGVRSWSRKALEKAGERVMNVQGDDDDNDPEEDLNRSSQEYADTKKDE
ncbi:MAG: hypothetical protein M1819_001116 [Sarea resinae]|nr:MAG: hypothetical protein M1819_001116 [Sarea resinae]